MKPLSWYAGKDLIDEIPQVGYYFYKQGKVLSLPEVREIVGTACICSDDLGRDCNLLKETHIEILIKGGIIIEKLDETVFVKHKKRLADRFLQFEIDLIGIPSEVNKIIFDFVKNQFAPHFQPGSPPELFNEVYIQYNNYLECTNTVLTEIEKKVKNSLT